MSRKKTVRRRKSGPVDVGVVFMALSVIAFLGVAAYRIVHSDRDIVEFWVWYYVVMSIVLSLYGLLITLDIRTWLMRRKFERDMEVMAANFWLRAQEDRLRRAAERGHW